MDEQQVGDWEIEVPSVVRKEQVHDYLRNLNVYKSTGTDKMNPEGYG